jgi:type VI secretion system secreted protein Hcp
MNPSHSSRIAAVAAAVTAALGAPSTTWAAVDLFLQLGDVKGESRDLRHKDEIDVQAWSWGLNGAVTGRHRQGHPACVHDLSVTKHADLASVRIIGLSVTGDAVPHARLALSTAGEKALEFLVIEMNDVRVTSVSLGSGSGDQAVSETVTLSFAAATVRYTPQKADGSAGAPQTTALGGGCPAGERRER